MFLPFEGRLGDAGEPLVSCKPDEDEVRPVEVHDHGVEMGDFHGCLSVRGRGGGFPHDYLGCQFHSVGIEDFALHLPQQRP